LSDKIKEYNTYNGAANSKKNYDKLEYILLTVSNSI